MALLDIEDRVAFGALAEDVALGFVGRDGPARADRCQKYFGVEGFARDLLPVLFLTDFALVLLLDFALPFAGIPLPCAS